MEEVPTVENSSTSAETSSSQPTNSTVVKENTEISSDSKSSGPQVIDDKTETTRKMWCLKLNLCSRR